MDEEKVSRKEKRKRKWTFSEQDGWRRSMPLLMTGCDWFPVCHGSVILGLPHHESKRQASSRDWLWGSAWNSQACLRAEKTWLLREFLGTGCHRRLWPFAAFLPIHPFSVWNSVRQNPNDEKKKKSERIKAKKIRRTQYHSGVLLYTLFSSWSIYGGKHGGPTVGGRTEDPNWCMHANQGSCAGNTSLWGEEKPNFNTHKNTQAALPRELVQRGE